MSNNTSASAASASAASAPANTTNQSPEPQDKKPRLDEEEGGAEKVDTKKLSGINVVLVSNDEVPVEFSVPIEHAQKSLVIGQFLSKSGENNGDDGSDEEGGMSEEEDDLADNDGKKFPLNEVDADNLKKIVEFLSYEYDHPFDKISKPLISNDMNEIVKDEFYVKFVDFKDQTLLMNLLKAANYLNIPSLLDLCCAKVASLLKDKSPEEVKKTFNIEGEFTEEEEAKVTAENPWLEEL